MFKRIDPRMSLRDQARWALRSKDFEKLQAIADKSTNHDKIELLRDLKRLECNINTWLSIYGYSLVKISASVLAREPGSL